MLGNNKMRLHDMLTESQINELGIIDKISSGIKGAVSNVQAGRSQRKGEEHSDRIVANLKADFMKMVGGGQSATYQNLVDFLKSHSLEVDEQPEVKPEQPQQSTQTTATSTATTTSPVTPPVAVPPEPEDDNPNIVRGYNESLAEDTSGVLTNLQIDKIIRDTVRKNYSRIVAAQQGRSTGTVGQQTSSPRELTGQASVNNTNIFSDPDKLAGEWAAYIAGGGRINRKLRKLLSTMQASLAVPPSMSAPKEKDPTMSINGQKLDPNNPKDAEMIAKIKAQDTTESVGYSRFLGIHL